MMIENGIVQLESVGYYHSPKYSSLRNLKEYNKMFGVFRILIFMIGMFVVPSVLIIIPLYLRHRTFGDVVLQVYESEVLEIKDGISSVFCEGHILKMNSPFNAFQINKHEVDAEHKKHLRLRKSMFLPDDSLEYWGFFLNQGSFVNLSLCSRYEGGRILMVKDTKELHTCGLLEHGNKAKTLPEIRLNHDAVHVKYETNAADREQYEGEDLSDELIKTYAENYVRHKLQRTPARVRERRRPATTHNRAERSLQPPDAVLHGKTDDEPDDSSASSFEETLIACHDGRILYHGNFTVSHLCNSTAFLEYGHHRQIQHDVLEDGYYFYIFYNDNDILDNEVHATFDILKPTFENNQNISGCLNRTECYFSVSVFSAKTVVVEVPTRNGIEDEDDRIVLTSTCKPRTAVYSVFLILLLISIFLSAFMGSGKTRL